LLIANSPPTFEDQQGDGSFQWQRHVGIAPAQLLGLTGYEQARAGVVRSRMDKTVANLKTIEG
jgi:hypothetical protein